MILPDIKSLLDSGYLNGEAGVESANVMCLIDDNKIPLNEILKQLKFTISQQNKQIEELYFRRGVSY